MKKRVIENDIKKMKSLIGYEIGQTINEQENNSSEFNTLTAQVREVGLRAADLKALKKEAEEKLSGEEKSKLISLIDSKLKETGI